MNISPASFIREQIEFDCPICCQCYDDDKRYPMMLCSAQHCCCLTCIQNIIFNKSEESECPFCKAAINKKDAKKFRLLHEIKETAYKLKENHLKAADESSKTMQQLQEELARERDKNVWLIQQMQQKEEQWMKQPESHEHQRLKAELIMRKFQVEHLKAVVRDQSERLSHQLIKENSLLNENIKMKLQQPHLHHSHPKVTFEGFQIIRKLGKGDYSISYLARQKRLGLLCTLKAIQKWKVKQLGLEETVLTDLKATSYLEHPNIIKVYGFFWDQKFVYAIGEYAVDQSLANYIKKHPKANYVPIVRQVTLAVQQLVTHSIVHNQINCNDIVLTFDDVVKLTGFSWATFIKKDSFELERYFKDIRALAPICHQIMHPEKPIMDTKSSLIRKEIEEELKKPEGNPNMLSFIELVLSKAENPFQLLSNLLAHPFLNDK